MKKIFNNLFPLFDHLYIYQNLEYNSWEFLKWFFKNPLRRNLQIKHKLDWGQKTKLLVFISLSLLIFDSVITSFVLSGGVWLSLILLLVKSLYSPLFLVVSQILILPLETFQKQKILNQAAKKLSTLNDLKVVAITGSFGKTSTKDILFTLLWKKYYPVKTPKSFNTPLGIAQTILEDLKKNTDIFICEVGAYKKGEVKKIASLIKPTMGIITAVAPQHLEKFGSLENIAHAKFELIESLPKNGLAILNGEDEWLKTLASNFTNCPTIFYGQSQNPYYAADIKTEIDGTSFTLHTPKGSINLKIPLIGKHHIQNFLAAATLALNLELTLSEIKDRAKLLLPTPHRMEVKKIGNMTLIDNSFNTNPKSSESSLKLLSGFEGRKIIITPGFIELGAEASKENQKFGKDMACLADEIIIVGKYAKLDLLDGIKKVWPDAEEKTHFVNSTQEGISLAQQLAGEYRQIIARNDVAVVTLLENDLPDQYS